ncbi:hypothetical protein AXFE_32090 [Acidithrix ferrooxidans]|uniref:Uncharacterized protein n=1 Tax=Acidithrix ferrooxidans TaxID=1280514 RepID=A0A0D8HDD4_9ACTN|nr:hypothetical protein AXFE_32090 [Acidithrix ferrooxidans]
MGEEPSRQPTFWNYLRWWCASYDPLGRLAVTSSPVRRTDMVDDPDYHLDVDLLAAFLSERRIRRTTAPTDQQLGIGLMDLLYAW